MSPGMPLTRRAIVFMSLACGLWPRQIARNSSAVFFVPWSQAVEPHPGPSRSLAIRDGQVPSASPRPQPGWPRLRFGSGFSRPSVAVESRDAWPMNASPRTSCILSGRRDCEIPANARDNVVSLEISTTHDQPRSLQPVDQMAGRRQIPYRPGDEGAGWRTAVFFWPTRTVPDITRQSTPP